MNIFSHSAFQVLLIIAGISIFLSLIYAAIISFFEKEKRATLIFTGLGVFTSLPILLLSFFESPYQYTISIIIFAIIIFIILVYFVPLKVTSSITDVFPAGQIDERNIMFSRNELVVGSKNYTEYYKKNPDKLKYAQNIKKNPGLLNEKSTKYHPAMYSSAHASFFTVEAFTSKVDGDISINCINYLPNDITTFIKNWTKKLGAVDVGITKLKEYHKYSYHGRKHNYGQKVELAHKYAIAFTVEMDFDALKTGPNAPSVMESAQQYLAAGAIAVQLAKFIRGLGHPAKAHIDGNYDIVCPLVAKDAGLGEIGRMGLLMTPGLGPRVRIAVVTTDIPLVVDNRSFNPSVINFCTNCKKCAEVCPSKAISINDTMDINGAKRWQINQEACFNFWTITGTDCGKCVSACPYSHPNNALHNVVRFGISNSVVFSRIALQLDNVIYGKKPTPLVPQPWMNISN